MLISLVSFISREILSSAKLLVMVEKFLYCEFHIVDVCAKKCPLRDSTDDKGIKSDNDYSLCLIKICFLLKFAFYSVMNLSVSPDTIVIQILRSIW